jgi:lysophospholipase L1-like esterase
MLGLGLPVQPRNLAASRARDLALSVGRASLLGCWPLDEASGTTAADRSGNGRDAAYSGTVTLGATGPFGDGTACITVAAAGAVNLYTSGLASAWNGDEATLDLWFKVSASGDWSDSTARNLLTVGADGSNTFYLRKQTAANTVVAVRVGSGTTSSCSVTISDTSWHHLAAVASKSGDYLRLFLDGALIMTATGLGSWSGSPASTLCMAGASSSSRAAPWKGSLSMPTLRSAALSPLEVARLARCTGHILFDGDSRLDLSTASPCPEQTMQISSVKALRYGFTRLAVSGQTWADMLADIASQGAANYRDSWRNVAVGWAGVNDAVGGADAPTIWARMQQWAGIVRGLGYKVVLCTEIDGANTALNNVSWHSTIWPALNTLIRNGYASVADGLADLGADSRLQDATNTTYIQADKVHPTAAGYGVAAGIIGAAVAAL